MSIDSLPGGPFFKSDFVDDRTFYDTDNGLLLRRTEITDLVTETTCDRLDNWFSRHSVLRDLALFGMLLVDKKQGIARAVICVVQYKLNNGHHYRDSFIYRPVFAPAFEKFNKGSITINQLGDAIDEVQGRKHGYPSCTNLDRSHAAD